MVYRGHVRNGRVELDEPRDLPEGAEIELTVVAPASRPAPRQHESFDEALDRIWGDVPESEWAKLPADLSDQLDHYVYGTPKR